MFSLIQLCDVCGELFAIDRNCICTMELDGHLEVVGGRNVEAVSPNTPLLDEIGRGSVAVASAQVVTAPPVMLSVASSTYVRPSLSYEQLAEFVYCHHGNPICEIIDNYWPATRVSAAERQSLYDMLSVGAATERRLAAALIRLRESARLEEELRAKLEKLIDERLESVVSRPPG